MNNSTIRHFDLAPDLSATLAECMDNYDVGDPDADWPNNIISRRAVVYSSGVIARAGEPVRHNVEPDELALCTRLAEEVCALMSGVEVGMGSEAGDSFRRFFVAANAGDLIPDRIDGALIQSKFGDTIFPLATVTVEPLEENGIWWSEVANETIEFDEFDKKEKYLRPWRALIKWFQEQPAFKDTAFVRIGDWNALHDLDENQWPEGTEIVPCVLPRLALGLTAHGSLVGLFGFSVQT